MKRLNVMVLVMALLPTLCLAAGVPTPDVIRNNEGFFQWILGLALLGNGLFMMRLLNSHDKLWERSDDQEKRLSHLEGAHDANHGD